MDDERFDALARSMGHPSGRSRRAVLGGLAGGLSAAAAAIVSPIARDEAVAGGALGGQLGGRHGKDSRGRDENRKNRRNNGKNNGRNNGKKNGNGGLGNPPGSSQDLTVRLIVENLTQANIDFQGWSLFEVESGKRCRKLDLATILPTQARTFQPNNWNADAFINQRYRMSGVIDTDHHLFEFPFVTMAHGGPLTRDCSAVLTEDLASTELGVGQSVERMIEEHRFEVLRENNIGDEVVFRIRVHS